MAPNKSEIIVVTGEPFSLMMAGGEMAGMEFEEESLNLSEKIDVIEIITISIEDAEKIARTQLSAVPMVNCYSFADVPVEVNYFFENLTPGSSPYYSVRFDLTLIFDDILADFGAVTRGTLRHFVDDVSEWEGYIDVELNALSGEVNTKSGVTLVVFDYKKLREGTEEEFAAHYEKTKNRFGVRYNLYRFNIKR
jgi:hypothetical protein